MNKTFPPDKIELFPPDKIELFPPDKIELFPPDKIELSLIEDKMEETDPLIAFHDENQIEYVNKNGEIISITKKDISWSWKNILNRCCIL